MKNLCRGLFLIGLLQITFPVYSFEYTYEGNTLEYTVLSSEGMTSYVSVKAAGGDIAGALVIPSTFELGGRRYVVTTVEEEGFAYNRKITSVDVPNTIITIRDKGFYACDKMTSISLKEGLREIGDRAFCNDSALVGTLTIPASVDTIADYAFGKLLSLENIQFLSETPARVGGGQVFLQTIANARILVPCGSYDVYASYYYTYLSSTGDTVYQYFWRDKVTDLCNERPMFADDKLRYRVINDKREVSVCNYLPRTIDGELRIPETVKVLGEVYYVVEVDSNVFNQRELSRKDVRITSLVLPKTMRKLNYAAFRCNHSLASVTLNEGLEYLGNRAFCKDSLLTNITIPSTVTFMGDYAIGDCPNLQWVEMLPPTPPTSDGGQLSGVPSADKCDIIVACGTKKDSNNGYMTTSPWRYRVLDVCNFNKDNLRFSRATADDTEVQVDGFVTRKAGALRLPASVRAGKYELAVTKVAKGAFSELNKGGHWLTSLEVPGTVRHIDDAAFRNCVNMTSVRLHEGLQVIGNRAFCSDSALTMVVLPSTLDSMGGYAFGVCPKLSSIYSMGETPAKRQSGNDNNPFNQVSVTGTLYVHCPDLAAYRDVWNGLLRGWTWGDNCELDIYHHNYPNAESLLTELEGDVEVYHIIYHRIFTSGQWETLYLPFEVESVTVYDTKDDRDYEIKPWVSGTGGNFWLLKQAGTYDEEGYPEFVTTDKTESFTPYLIQFKDAWFDDKVVTFRSTYMPEVSTQFSVQRGSTAQMFGNNTLVRHDVSGVYLLENNGQVFQHSSLSRTLYPFECYVTDGVGTSAQSRRFAIRYREAVPTDCGKVISGTEMLCTVSGNSLTIQTNGEAVSVYSVNGMLLQAFPAGTETATINLESGYYIVASEHGSQRVVL